MATNLGANTKKILFSMIDAYCIYSIESNLLVLESAVNVLALAFGGIFPANFNEAVCIHIRHLEK